jgi:hypothetical protein
MVSQSLTRYNVMRKDAREYHFIASNKRTKGNSIVNVLARIFHHKAKQIKHHI